MKKLLQSLFLLLLFVASQAMAQVGQERTVTGTVTAKEDGLPLPGVSVLVKGTQVGTQTDANGKFSIKVPASRNQLEFRFVGFSTHTLTLTSANSVSVALNADTKELGEVVVTGYVAQTKKEFTGASARVSGGVIADRPVQSFGQGLTGQAAGVSIVQPNGLLNNPPVIRVRGISSISLSSFPLVVVDGIPISTSNVSANSSTNNPLGDINPSDIESIDILKDAASTAVYGSRAAAGVLVITTKKGKQGQSKVTYEGWAGMTQATRLPQLLDAQQYIDYKNMAVANVIAINPTGVVSAAQRDASGKSFFPNYNADGSMVNTNWLDQVYRTAYSQNHNISVSGASAKTSYYVSAGISDQDGFLKNNSFGRRSGRVNLTHSATDWMKLSVNMNYVNSMNKSPNSGSSPGSAFNSSGLGRIAFALSPNLASHKADGSYNLSSTGTVANGSNLIPTSWANPAALIDLDKNSSETSRLIANLGADIKLYKGLTFRTAYSWDRGNTENIQFWNPLSGDGFSYNGYAYNNAARRENWNLINTLQYNATFGGNHNLTMALVSDIQKTRTQNWGAVRQGLADPFFNQFQGNYGTNVTGGNGIGQTSYTAYIATLNYNYAGKYFISGNFRRDGNSSLSKINRFGNFGGASLGWTVSEEDFFKNSGLEDKLSSLKLRASWGRVGNGNIPNYTSFTTYSSGLFGGSPTWVFNQAGNEELKWETSQQTNFGIDLGFLNNRISLEADYFNKNVDNMILEIPQAPSKGIPNTNSSILANIGSMYNKGFELALTGRPFTGKFSWTSTLNFATIKNQVTSLVEADRPIIGATGGLESASITKVGYPIGSLYAVKTAGVNPENGRRIFINKDGKQVQYLHGGGNSAWTYMDGSKANPISLNDAQIMGAATPTWYGGFNNTFRYANFDAGLMFTFSGGNYIYNGSRAGLLDQRVWNNSTEVLKAWKNPGDKTDIPRAVFGDNTSNGSAFPIDANVEKGNFLRLQTATLGYTIPASVFKQIGISSVRLYGQVNNAWLWTKYTGADPEISSNGGENLMPGVERNSIPQGRTVTFGLNVGF